MLVLLTLDVAPFVFLGDIRVRLRVFAGWDISDVADADMIVGALCASGWIVGLEFVLFIAPSDCGGLLVLGCLD